MHVNMPHSAPMNMPIGLAMEEKGGGGSSYLKHTSLNAFTSRLCIKSSEAAEWDEICSLPVVLFPYSKILCLVVELIEISPSTPKVCQMRMIWSDAFQGPGTGGPPDVAEALRFRRAGECFGQDQ
jgi:hypothetical protein